MAALIKINPQTQFVIRYFDGKAIVSVTFTAESRKDAIEQFKQSGYLPSDIFSID